MLLIAKSLQNLTFSGLMEVYEESNRENAAELWPDLEENIRMHRAEQEFYQYLQEVFFAAPGAVYAVWTEAGKYCSALRLEPYQDGLLLEALETTPGQRKKGYAVALIHAVQAYLREAGAGPVYSHVSKRNTASLRTHETCGFQRILEHAVYIDGTVRSNICTLCWRGE